MPSPFGMGLRGPTSKQGVPMTRHRRTLLRSCSGLDALIGALPRTLWPNAAMLEHEVHSVQSTLKGDSASGIQADPNVILIEPDADST
jgi:hypothetical protein